MIASIWHAAYLHTWSVCQHVCMEEMCRDSPLILLNTTYMQTPIYIRQTGLPFLSLSYFQHYSVCFTCKWWSYWKKILNVLFHVFAIKQLMYWTSHFDLESRFTLFSMQCLWSQITTHHIQHINNDVKRVDGIIFFPFWHVSCISIHLHNILHALSFAGWHMMAMRTICTKMVDLWIAWCYWKFLIDSCV